MPDPPIMPSTALVMIAPVGFCQSSLDQSDYIATPYSTIVSVPQSPLLATQGRVMSTAQDQTKRHQIIDACREMNRLGINQGTSGNISLRHDDGMLITPTSVPYDAMQAYQIVFMKL